MRNRGVSSPMPFLLIPRSLLREVSLFPDFSVVLFRPNFMLVSEEHPMKTHKNQWLLNHTIPS